MAQAGAPLSGRISTARHPKADEFSRPGALPSALPGARSKLPVRMGRDVIDVCHHAGSARVQGRSRRRGGDRRPTIRPQTWPRQPLRYLDAIQRIEAAGRFPKTWSGYAQHWELRISPRFGHVPVDEISRKDVQQFIGGLTVGPWAKLATLRLLRSILDMAREDGRIHINPAQGVSSGRIPARERHRYLSATEVAALAHACGDQGDIVTILAFTGLRWSNSSACASATSTSKHAASTSAKPPRT